MIYTYTHTSRRADIVCHGTLALGALLFLPSTALAAPQNFRDLVALFVLIINVATPALIALALALFLTRAVLTATGAGGEKDKGYASARFRKMAAWGIGVMFVMVSIWGILRLMENTFLGNDVGALGVETIDEFCVGLNDC